MSSLRDQVISEVEQHVHISYVNRDTCKWWNGKRKDDDLRVFTGWYWTKGKQEAGPFKTYSSAARDAWYRFVQHREPPRVNIK